MKIVGAGCYLLFLLMALWPLGQLISSIASGWNPRYPEYPNERPLYWLITLLRKILLGPRSLSTEGPSGSPAVYRDAVAALQRGQSYRYGSHDVRPFSLHRCLTGTRARKVPSIIITDVESKKEKPISNFHEEQSRRTQRNQTKYHVQVQQTQTQQVNSSSQVKI